MLFSALPVILEHLKSYKIKNKIVLLLCFQEWHLTNSLCRTFFKKKNNKKRFLRGTGTDTCQLPAVAISLLLWLPGQILSGVSDGDCCSTSSYAGVSPTIKTNTLIKKI